MTDGVRRLNHEEAEMLISARMDRFNGNLLRLRRRVGEEGKINERMPTSDAPGSWAERIEAINALVSDLSQPTVEVGRVIGAVAQGFGVRMAFALLIPLLLLTFISAGRLGGKPG